MNARQRFPGNGYRSNAIPSRISPETSIRSHPNFYNNSDNRNFHRPFGRMHPKSPSPMQHQVPRKGNLFIEAGRLAVDYLISHGLLPPDVLSNPSSNGNLKINDHFEFSPKHQQVAEDLISPREAQSTAPISSDKSVSAADASEIGRSSPVNFKEKRRLLRPFSSTDLITENGRNGSLPDKGSTSVDVIANCNSVPTQRNAMEVDTNISNSIEDGAHIKQYQDEKSISSQKSNSSVDDIAQSTDQLSSIHVALEKEGNRSDLGDEDAGKNSTIRYCEEEVGISRKDHNDLLKLCSSELPTKPFTSARPADLNLLMLPDGRNNNCQASSAAQFIVPVKNTSNSDPSGSSAYELCGPMDKVRGEKRSLETIDAKDNPKKVKGWLTDLHNDESSQLSVSENKRLGSQELVPLPGRVGIPDLSQDSAAIGSLLSKVGVGPSVAYSEEKQLFPGCFKICDLNLMEVSDAHETHKDSTIVYSSNQVPTKDVSVDIDLSMSNSCNLHSMYSKYELPDKGIEIIDLESDPLQGDKGIHTSARRMQSEFTGIESFPNHLQNPSENPDVQDGYGLMLSEFMGNDIQNCSSAQPEMNSLHNDIGLHHGESILSDDDQIYMSLGEIPLSLMRSWDPATQDYEKPF